MAERTCRDCGESKPVTKFRGTRQACYACTSRRNRKRYPDTVRLSVKRAHAKNRDVYRQRYAETRARHMRQWKAANRARTAEYERQRRIRKRGIEQVRYDRRDIFERDGWICGLCGEPVADIDARLKDGPTIDHIIALADGGIDAPSNVQLAHRRCNAAKRPLCMTGRPPT